MGDRSKIEWCNATWNPTTGCTKVSAGCKFCYAEREFPRVYPGRAFSNLQTHPERLEQPLHWRRPRRIFVDSMSDLFHNDVSDDFIDKVFGIVARCKWHRAFQVLTKKADRMQHYFSRQDRGRLITQAAKSGCDENSGTTWLSRWSWPIRNLWLGVSVEDQKIADERIPLLLQTPAAVRFVSYEPALAAINLKLWLRSSQLPWRSLDMPEKHFLDWVIAGGESGPHARPSHPSWFESVVKQCVSANIPVFVKQLGGWPDKRGGEKAIVLGQTWNEFPAAKP